MPLASLAQRVALSFDVEDWFQVLNMQEKIPPERWSLCEGRIWEGMEFILEELEKRQIRATFFVLGWIAERHPEMLKRLAAGGHEIASHGYGHRPLHQLGPEGFRRDLERSLSLLRALSGQEIKGYRAPSFSITKQTLWALPILKEAGLLYDSSIFPIRHPDYGILDFGSRPRRLSEGLIALPMTVLKQGPWTWPTPGGGYFRLLPWALSASLLKKQLAEGLTPILYFHPWEFDGAQPRVPLPLLKRFRHYVGLRANRQKFCELLDSFSFCTLEDVARSCAEGDSACA